MTAALLVMVIPAAFACYTALPVLLKNQPWLPDIAGTAENILTGALGLPVRIGHIDITPGGNLRLHDVQVFMMAAEGTEGSGRGMDAAPGAEGDIPGAVATATAGEVVVDLSLHHLLATRNLQAAVIGFNVKDLSLTIDDDLAALKSLPLSTGLEDQAGSGRGLSLPFPVTVEDAELVWRDYNVKAALLHVRPTDKGPWLFDFTFEVDKVPAVGTLNLKGKGRLAPDGLSGLDVKAAWSGGSARATGDIFFNREDCWYINFSAPQLQLPLTVGPISQDKGIKLAGEVRGPWQKPVISLEAAQRPHELSATVEVAYPMIDLPFIKALVDGEVYEGSGWFDLSTLKPAVILETHNIKAEKALAWAGLAWPWQGELSGRVEVVGTVSAPVFHISFSSAAGTVFAQEYTELEGQIVYSSGQVEITEAEALVAGGRLQAGGEVSPAGRLNLKFTAEDLAFREINAGLRRYSPDEKSTIHRLSLAMDNLLPLESCSGVVLLRGSLAEPEAVLDLHGSGSIGRKPVVVTFGGQGRPDLSYSGRLDMKVDEGRLWLAGEAGGESGGTMAISGGWQNLPAAFLSSYTGYGQMVEGTLDGDLTLSYDGGDWDGEVSFHSARLGNGPSWLEDIGGRVVLEGGLIKLVDWQGSASGRKVELVGTLPLAALLSAGDLFGLPGTAVYSAPAAAGEAIDITAVIPKGPIEPLLGWLALSPSWQEIVSSINKVKGAGQMHLHLSGAVGAWRMNGEAAWSGAELSMPGMDLKGDVTLQISGMAAEPRLTGRLVLRSVDINLLELDWANLSRQFGGSVADTDPAARLGLGSMPTTRPTIKRHPLLLPHIIPDPPSSGTVPAGGLGNPALALEINLERLRIRAGSLLDVTANGQLALAGNLKQPVLKGELTSGYGRLNYLGTNFVIEDAVAGFHPYQGFQPEISLSASTWIGEHVIALLMSGSYPDLQIRLASEPPLSQQEIMAMLGWPGYEKARGELNTAGAFAKSLFDILQGSVQRELVGKMENTLRDELGLDMLYLEPDLFRRSLRILAGKYVLPKVYLSYERSLFGASGEEWRLEYKFDRDWKFSAGLGEESGFSVKLEMKTRF